MAAGKFEAGKLAGADKKVAVSLYNRGWPHQAPPAIREGVPIDGLLYSVAWFPPYPGANLEALEALEL